VRSVSELKPLQFRGGRLAAKLQRESTVLSGVMQPTPPRSFADPDEVETLPASELVAETATPIPECAWDSEAPTAVHSRRPLFARPPRLPRT
jgi:hypothetical protein